MSQSKKRRAFKGNCSLSDLCSWGVGGRQSQWKRKRKKARNVIALVGQNPDRRLKTIPNSLCRSRLQSARWKKTAMSSNSWRIPEPQVQIRPPAPLHNSPLFLAFGPPSVESGVSGGTSDSDSLSKQLRHTMWLLGFYGTLPNPPLSLPQQNPLISFIPYIHN